MHARRWKLSVAQRADMWSRWKAGQSLNAIGRALGKVGKDHPVIQLLLARHGGIAPPARRRSRRVLTLAEREDISRGIVRGYSIRPPDCIAPFPQDGGSPASAFSWFLAARFRAAPRYGSGSVSKAPSWASRLLKAGSRQRQPCSCETFFQDQRFGLPAFWASLVRLSAS